MKKKLFVTFLLAIALFALLSISSFAASSGGATVTASALNLRAEASIDSDILTVAPRGSVIVVLRDVGTDWVKVWYKGETGYMASEYLCFSETLDGNFGTGTIVGTNVRVRDSASTSGGILGECKNGDTFKIFGVSGEWYKISYKDNTGYINRDYLSLEDAEDYDNGSRSAVPSSNSSTPGQKIVDTASQYLGTKYVWAGTSAKGFDCSGFVYYVYKECGYSVNRTAASLYSNGTAVDKADLQAGDIICFTNGGYSYIGHVGIYIGDGQFIHASSSAGKVVVTDLDTKYYTNHYYGARRVAE